MPNYFERKQQMKYVFFKNTEKALERLDASTIPEVEPLPDEIAAHAKAMEEYRRGEVLSHEDIDWN